MSTWCVHFPLDIDYEPTKNGNDLVGLLLDLIQLQDEIFMRSYNKLAYLDI